MPPLRCRGLTKRYRSRAVVADVDLDVDAGEVVGFVGPNGAGKTTAIRMLLGLVRPDAGQAWLLGSEVPCPARLGAVGAIVEEPAFYPWMTGRRNLEVVAGAGAPVAAGAIDDALGLTGIADAAGQKVKTYSQGMRQRLGLAAAVLRGPAIVILDEPANGLDPAGIHDLRLLVRHLAEAGSSVLLSSHLLGEVEQVCDRVAVIDGGRMVTGDSVARLRAAGRRVDVTVEAHDVERARTALSAWDVTAGGRGGLEVHGAGGREVNACLLYTSDAADE